MKKIGERVKRVVTVAVLLAAGSAAFGEAAKLKDIVNPKYYDQLVKDGMVRIIHSTDDLDLKLVPAVDFKSKVLENKVVKVDGDYPFVTESLYVMTKEELLKTSNSKKTDISLDDVSVIFRSISKMEGMEYYSHTRKKNEVLYKSTYAVDGPETRNKIADQTSGNANGKVLYVFQQDTSFGKCVYELHYYQDENTLYAEFNNLDDLGIGPIHAVNPRNMIINVMAIDCGDSLCLYLSTDTDCIKFPGIAKTLEDSLTSRMDAIKSWFTKQF